MEMIAKSLSNIESSLDKIVERFDETEDKGK